MAFENKVLDKLLRGVLEGKPVDIGKRLIDRERIEEVIGELPISLSENQVNAVYNAWANEISYIQGPPGTGKSHTITALMLSAILLQKRVLMVSHKPAAVNVVRRMIEKHLGGESIIFLGEDKKELRAVLQRMCNHATSMNAPRRLLAMKSKLEDLQKQNQRLVSQVESIRLQIRECLQNENDFFKTNSAFIIAREHFAKDFSIQNAPENISLVRKMGADREKNYRQQLKRIHHILQNKRAEQSGHLTQLQWHFIRSVFVQSAKVLHTDLGRLTPELATVGYLNEHLALTMKFTRLVESRARIAADFLLQQRTVLHRKETALNENQRELLRAQHQFNLQNALSGAAASVTDFEKMLHWKSPQKIRERMGQIDYSQIIGTFPLWVGQMRDLGNFLPFTSGLFDLVIIDEASQVNIAEILPAFYRGQRFCVVGDQKQLGLDSAGMMFLNTTFEQLIWNQFFGTNSNATTYDQAKNHALLVSRNSILDFITCPQNRLALQRATLNEHFRSLPQLASFTSDQFYQEEGGLRLMKELPDHLQKICFRAVEVGGVRIEDAKIVPEEVNELVRRLRQLMREKSYETDADLAGHGFKNQNGSRPSIGIISITTDQRNYIRTCLEEEFSDDERTEYSLTVGTPEDFQGDERHIIFITLGLDGEGRYARGHYEQANRFNVATSRAICFTYAIFGGIPANAHLIKKYLRHFGAGWKELAAQPDAEAVLAPSLQRYAWRYRPEQRDSEFEIRVSEYLQEFIQSHGGGEKLELYNQVQSCGQKRLDFVLYNKTNHRYCAVEVDGKDHYNQGGRSYSEAHLERVETLKRAGWKIVHVPYYHWYKNGWLCDRDNREFNEYLKVFYRSIEDNLF